MQAYINCVLLFAYEKQNIMVMYAAPLLLSSEITTKNILKSIVILVYGAAYLSVMLSYKTHRVYILKKLYESSLRKLKKGIFCYFRIPLVILNSIL